MALVLSTNSPLFFLRFRVFDQAEFWHTSPVMPDSQQITAPPALVDAVAAPEPAPAATPPRKQLRSGIVELGGPAGPEPTRYGDWEKNGRCIDF
jgi:hypothetical protein